MAATASKRASNIRKEGEKTLKSVGKAAEKEFENVAKTTRRQARRVARRAENIEDQAIAYVKENPYAAIGIAAGLGAIAAVLLTRR
jgi:ElaB/YqjD/DUF883 family membrane-anchored ribosome-binding protein